MRGALAALFTVVLLLALASAAPVPKEQENQLYFPTKVGARWVYQCGDFKPTFVVTAVEADGGGKVVSVGREEDGQVTPSYRVSVSEKGLKKLTNNSGEKLDPPMEQLRLPPTPGRKWVWDEPDAKATFTVREREWVEVPAGWFKAGRVECDYMSGTLPHWAVDWYFPGIGPVKKTIDGLPYKDLISFSPGKD